MLLAKCCWGLSPGASIVASPNGFVWRHSIPAPWGPWPRFAIASRRSGTVACGWVPNTLKDILWYFHVFPMRFLWPWFIFENWWTVWYPDRSVNKKLLSLGLGPCVGCSCSNCWLSNVRAWYPTVVRLMSPKKEGCKLRGTNPSLISEESKFGAVCPEGRKDSIKIVVYSLKTEKCLDLCPCLCF